MMSEQDLQNIIAHLKTAGVVFEAGLNEDEFRRVEQTLNIAFPPDLKQFLATALPVSPDFPNWRSGAEVDLRRRLNHPFDGLYFDIEHNNFWLKAWGERPAKLEVALTIAKTELANVPKLIPIYVHRFIPTEPLEAGNPVFSIYQSDIVYYGFDLAAYLSHEFKIPNPTPVPQQPRTIRFWSQLVS